MSVANLMKDYWRGIGEQERTSLVSLFLVGHPLPDQLFWKHPTNVGGFSIYGDSDVLNIQTHVDASISTAATFSFIMGMDYCGYNNDIGLQVHKNDALKSVLLIGPIDSGRFSSCILTSGRTLTSYKKMVEYYKKMCSGWVDPC